MTNFKTLVGSIAVQPYMSVRYPHITVPLSEAEGNVYNLIGIVRRALEKAGVDRVDVAHWVQDAHVCKTYDEVLTLIMQTVDIT